MPTLPDHIFLGHPVLLTGGESEGGTATQTVDSNTVVPVVAIQHVPAVGDVVVATLAGGRWVVDKGAGGGTCTVPFNVRGCANLPYPGVLVSAYDHSGGTLLDSGTTDSGGNVTLSWTGIGATYWVTVTGQSTRFAAYAQSMVLACGFSSPIVLTPASGYQCTGLCLLPAANTLNGTWTLGASSGTFTLTGTTNWVGTVGICSATLVAATLRFDAMDGNPPPTTTVCPTSFSVYYSGTSVCIGAGAVTMTITE
jgi:hypothetical protein